MTTENQVSEVNPDLLPEEMTATGLRIKLPGIDADPGLDKGGRGNRGQRTTSFDTNHSITTLIP